MYCYLGWKAVHVIDPSNPSYFWIYFLFYTSHTINFLSYPPEQTKDIYEFIFAEFTQLLCPMKDALNLRVSMSYNLIDLSSEAVRIFLPSLENSTDLTAALCPLIILVFI